jgi:ATP-dependent DNA helicase DinG
VLEVQVHQQLRRLRREETSEDPWPHQLAMGRIIARALRRQESVLVQTGVSAELPTYRLSYLAPALLHPGPVAIVTDSHLHDRLLAELPQLQTRLGTAKPISPEGLIFLGPYEGLGHNLPTMPIIIDGADRLADWLQEYPYLQTYLMPENWQSLIWAIPAAQPEIDNCFRWLHQSLFQRPQNPYDCYLLTDEEIDRLQQLSCYPKLPDPWPEFFERMLDPQNLVWAEINRQYKIFTLCTQQKNINAAREDFWAPRPYLLIGNVLDVDQTATNYRQEMGLGEMTCVKFAVSSHPLRLYTPNWMPMPNSRNFQEMFIREALNLLHRHQNDGLVVVIVGDTPLKTQVASRLAAEYGSLVRLEEKGLATTQILVTGWEFWNNYQDQLPAPTLIVVATLPIPSLEDPLVAAQVNLYKQQRKDWFRGYLLPIGLRTLLRSIAPVRSANGLLAILDNRLNHRSYGQQILEALKPCIKLTRW